MSASDMPFVSNGTEILADGLPRISREGIGILLEGMEGNLDRWEHRGYCNHPYCIPQRCTRLCSIEYGPDFAHPFVVKFSYNRWIVGLPTPIACFERVDIGKPEFYPPENHIRLCMNDDWYPYVPIWIGDMPCKEWDEATAHIPKTHSLEDYL